MKRKRALLKSTSATPAKPGGKGLLAQARLQSDQGQTQKP